MEKESSSSAREAVVSAGEQPAVQAVIHDAAHELVLPRKTLIVLCGPAGAGKSTFARHFVDQHEEQGYRATSIVSSDYCRALLCDDENSQQFNRDTFDLFYFIIRKRLYLGFPTIADSTALQQNARLKLLEIARGNRFKTCLLVFNMSLQTCMRHDQHHTRGRTVGEQVIAYHLNLLHQALPLIPTEGWDYIVVLDDQQSDVAVKIQS